MRLIDGDALEKFLSDAEIEATRQRKYVFASALNTICGNVRNFPTIESERKKGKWQWCGNHHLCSECDEWALTRWNEDECDEVDILTDFCPNCGADMRGEQE